MASADPTKLENSDCSATIAATADRLRALTRRSLQAGWQMAQQPDPQVTSATEGWTTWPFAAPNAKQHIAWARGQKALWLCQQITVPTALQDFPLAGSALRLGLTWWAEVAAVYVDGQLMQEGDLFDYFGRILLSDRVTPGDTFWVAIYLVSPGHDDGALVELDARIEASRAVDLTRICLEEAVAGLGQALIALERAPDVAPGATLARAQSIAVYLARSVAPENPLRQSLVQFYGGLAEAIGRNIAQPSAAEIAQVRDDFEDLLSAVS